MHDMLRYCLFLLLFLPACALGNRRAERTASTPSSTAALGTTVVETLSSGGETRSYRLHLPVDFAAATPTPLIINLHGYNSNATQQEQISQMSVKADEAGFIVVYPEGRSEPQRWYFGTMPSASADEQFIHDLVNHLASRYAVDPARIYVTGISNGAEMSLRLMCDMADVFAAAGLVAGGYPAVGDCAPSRPVPVVVFHGKADHILAYEGNPPFMVGVQAWAQQWAEQNGCPKTSRNAFQAGTVTGEIWSPCQDEADVVLYTIPGGGHTWPGSTMPNAIATQEINATDLIWKFFVAHPQP